MQPGISSAVFQLFYAWDLLDVLSTFHEFALNRFQNQEPELHLLVYNQLLELEQPGPVLGQPSGHHKYTPSQRYGSGAAAGADAGRLSKALVNPWDLYFG
jgi:hypothetical protein